MSTEVSFILHSCYSVNFYVMCRSCTELDYKKNSQLRYDSPLPSKGNLSSEDFFHFVSMAVCQTYTDNRPQKVMINKTKVDSRCAPSLHSTDCASVTHDCMIFRRCYDDFQRQFTTRRYGDNFGCRDEGYYRVFHTK